MKIGKLKLSGLLVASMLLVYIFAFSGSYIFYLFSSMNIFLTTNHLLLKSVLGWVTVGLGVSLLATLAVWPFALSAATLLEHNKSHFLSKYFLKLISYFSTLPLLIFAYVYIEVVGPRGFLALKSFWLEIFSSINLFTQAIAFALTLLLYPLTVLPVFAEKLTVDLFFKKMLQAVFDFSEVGLVTSVIVLGLFLYIFPKMVLNMRKQLSDDGSLRSFEIIQSIGGTTWESIHLTVMQSMKSRFNSIIVYFTRMCFFEGLITFTLLHFFFLNGSSQKAHWSSTLSSQFVGSSVESKDQLGILLGISGILVICYTLFICLEYYFHFKTEVERV